mmetsp:Transcript_20365/g.56345  ORF Transcript_20365/g.56345 Transcript_20365/m.56345 type:complete len:191 (-) Transcript_20365:68-640(-)
MESRHLKVFLTTIFVLAVVGLNVFFIAKDKPEQIREDQRSLLLSQMAEETPLNSASKQVASQRARLRHLIVPIANHLATRYLYTEVAQRARANPTQPGHQAMQYVLASKREEEKIEGMVKNKLANVHSGEWAEEIHRKTPAKYQALIPALANQAAHTSTVFAFKHLKEQMLAAEKNPTYLKHLSPTDPNA